MRRVFGLLLAAALLPGLAGCVNQHPAGEPAAAGGEAPRLVATSPAVVDICARLDLDLAGVPESVLVPTPQRYANAAKIGAAMSPDLEALAALRPGYVLSPASLEHDLRPKYDAAGLRCVFLDLHSVQGMYESIARLGALLRREDRAAALAGEFERFCAGLRQRGAKRQAPRVLILMGLPGAYVAATENSYVGSLAALAGGVNVYAGTREEFLSANTEDMRQKNPDIILRAAHAMPEEVAAMFAKEFAENDIWKHFEAVRAGRVHDLAANNFGMSANFNYPQAIAELERIFDEHKS